MTRRRRASKLLFAVRRHDLDRDERYRLGTGRFADTSSPLRLPAERPAPGIDLLRQKIVPTRHRGQTLARRLSLGQHRQLDLTRPGPAPLRAGQDLHPPHHTDRFETNCEISFETSRRRPNRARTFHRTDTLGLRRRREYRTARKEESERDAESMQRREPRHEKPAEALWGDQCTTSIVMACEGPHTITLHLCPMILGGEYGSAQEVHVCVFFWNSSDGKHVLAKRIGLPIVPDIRDELVDRRIVAPHVGLDSLVEDGADRDDLHGLIERHT